jgi:hypothetical protein
MSLTLSQSAAELLVEQSDSDFESSDSSRMDISGTTPTLPITSKSHPQFISSTEVIERCGGFRKLKNLSPNELRCVCVCVCACVCRCVGVFLCGAWVAMLLPAL